MSNYNIDMFRAYLEKNPAHYYVLFAKLPSRVGGCRAYAITRETMRNLPDVAPEMFDGGTDGVPRVKLLMYNKTEAALNRAGGILVKHDFATDYRDVQKGLNGTRSSALEKMSAALFEGLPGISKVTHIGNLKGSESGAIADLRIDWINGAVEYCEIKCRCGRFNVQSGKDGFTKGDQDYNFRIIYDGGSKDIILLEDARVFQQMLSELGYDSTIIDLTTETEVE